VLNADEHADDRSRPGDRTRTSRGTPTVSSAPGTNTPFAARLDVIWMDAAFAIIFSKNDLNLITMGILLQRYFIVREKQETNISISEKRRYDQPRITLGQITTISIMFRLLR
jgi:hypothetical protein